RNICSEGAIRKALVEVRPRTERDTIHMDDQELVRHITSLQARMNRMEALMQQLLTILTTSRADVEQTMQMQTMLQELRFSPAIHTAASNPSAVTPQERPEI